MHAVERVSEREGERLVACVVVCVWHKARTFRLRSTPEDATRTYCVQIFQHTDGAPSSSAWWVSAARWRRRLAAVRPCLQYCYCLHRRRLYSVLILFCFIRMGIGTTSPHICRQGLSCALGTFVRITFACVFILSQFPTHFNMQFKANSNFNIILNSGAARSMRRNLWFWPFEKDFSVTSKQAEWKKRRIEFAVSMRNGFRSPNSRQIFSN